MLTLPCPHFEFEQQHPDELEAAKAYEQNRQALHISRHGSLDGFRPSRDFPCLGILAVVDQDGPQWTVTCSACSFETTIRSPDRPAKQRTLEEAKW